MPQIELDDLCNTITEELQEAVSNGDKIHGNEPVGLLTALLSPENTANTTIQTDYDRRDGMNSDVWLRYRQPYCESDTSTECTNICDKEGDFQPYVWTRVTADQCGQSPVMQFNETQMREFCETGSEYRMKMIAEAMNGFRRNVNRQLIPLYSSQVGGLLNGGGGCCTPYNFFVRDAAGNLSVDPEGQVDMELDLDDAGFSGVPIVVGGREMKKYAKYQDIACCNSVLGHNSGELTDLQIYYDNQIDQELTGPSNDHPFFVWVPGMAVFISRPKNKAQFRKVNDLFVHDTIIDPLLGLEMDFFLKYDDCTGTYKWLFQLPFGLWQPPLTLYKDCDGRDGINLTWQFQLKTRD